MRKKLKPLKQQTIVITGASSGIGLTTARMAAKRGANVVLISRNAEALDRICTDIRAQGGNADFIVADVGEREQVRKAVDTVIERHGGFDTWVNNAGIGVYATLEQTSDEDHHRLFQTNYWGVVYGSTEALRHLRERGGALINIGSISSDLPSPILSAYAATKHAVKGFTDSLRMELQYQKVPVSVTLIQPSGIHTPFGDHARNYMDNASQVPPPVYHPRVVARAILHAAQYPTRNLIVGGAGMLLVSFAQLLPRAADYAVTRMFYLTAVNRDEPAKHESALHSPGRGGRELGDQDAHMMKHSAYTAARMHPKTTLAAGLATIAAVIAGAKLAQSKDARRALSDAGQRALHAAQEYRDDAMDAARNAGQFAQEKAQQVAQRMPRRH